MGKSSIAFRPSFAALLAGAGFAAALLAGCAPDLGVAPVPKPPGAYAAAQSLQGPAADWPSDAWWTVYGDPQLDALIGEALAGSPDVAVAAARVRGAQATAERDRAYRTPDFSGAGSIQTTKLSKNQGFPDSFKDFLPGGFRTQTRATIDLDWQLDFFGAARARLASSTSLADALAADKAAAALQLSTSVASAYAQLGRLYADRDAALEAVRVRRETVELVNRRLVNGLETRGELATAQGGVPAAQADVDALDRQITLQRHYLAALLGAGPDRGLAIARPAPLQLKGFGLPAEVTTDLIGRRPDLSAARARAEAAASRIRAAKAAYYPSISLTGSYGLSSLGVDTFLQTPDSLVGALGPAIRLPIFAGAQLNGNLRGARAEYDEAVALYDRTLVVALRDVADAAAGVQALQVELNDARQSLASAEEAYRIARLRYTGGLAPYLNVLTAEGTLLVNRRNVADLQAQAAGLDVDLVRALGGGFRDLRAARPLRTAAR